MMLLISSKGLLVRLGSKQRWQRTVWEKSRVLLIPVEKILNDVATLNNVSTDRKTKDTSTILSDETVDTGDASIKEKEQEKQTNCK